MKTMKAEISGDYIYVMINHLSRVSRGEKVLDVDFFEYLERMKQAQLERYMPCPGIYGDIIEGVQYDIDMDAKVEIKDHYRILRLDGDNNIIQETIIYRKPTSKPAKIYED